MQIFNALAVATIQDRSPDRDLRERLSIEF
jgi:hypothetical protein